MARQDSWLENNLWTVVILAIAAMIILPAVFNYWMAPVVFEQNRQAGEEIAEDSIDADVALREYREFRTLWFDIKAAREQLENYKAQEEQFHETYGNDPSEWSRSAETRHGRLHDRIVGQQNQISNLVAEYNAMQADATKAIFQCGLPWSIDEKLFIADASGVEYTSQEARDKTPPESPEECKFASDPNKAGASNTTG
jgi:hypothetical protein